MTSLASGTRLDDEHHDTVGRTALVVEDEPTVRGVVERCLRQLELVVWQAADAAEARDRLGAVDVDLLVTDLELPGESGIEFLRSLTPDDRPAVLILTGSEDPQAVQSSLDLGAYAYIVKPPTVGGLQVAAAGAIRQKSLERMHRSTIAMLRNDLAERTAAGAASAQAFTDALGALARAIESRDLVTGDHVYRMSSTCALLAAELGMSTDEQHALALAARLHDVGNVTLPDRLLIKGSPLDERELWVMQSHCQAGYEILAGSSSAVLELAADIALTHHEWFDGCGYPRGLRGEEIPLAGRISAIADTFDALTHERPYRPPLTMEAALDVMRRERGTHFDPALLDLFLALQSAIHDA